MSRTILREGSIYINKVTCRISLYMFVSWCRVAVNLIADQVGRRVGESWYPLPS